MIYIATFYSHFGAMRCKELCDERSIASKLMPVPRSLSSSCGTCLRMEAEKPDILPETEEMEQLVLQAETGYELLWKAEDS